MARRPSPGRACAPAIRWTGRSPTGGSRTGWRAQAPLLRGGDEHFYPDREAVYRDNVERVYRLMFAKVGNRPDAQDLTAHVFLAALRPLRISVSVAEMRAYLLAAAALALAALAGCAASRTIRVFQVRRVRRIPACSPGPPQCAGRDRSPGPARRGRC